MLGPCSARGLSGSYRIETMSTQPQDYEHFSGRLTAVDWLKLVQVALVGGVITTALETMGAQTSIKLPAYSLMLCAAAYVVSRIVGRSIRQVAVNANGIVITKRSGSLRSLDFESIDMRNDGLYTDGEQVLSAASIVRAPQLYESLRDFRVVNETNQVTGRAERSAKFSTIGRITPFPIAFDTN